MKTNESGKTTGQKKASTGKAAPQAGEARSAPPAASARRGILPSTEKVFAVSYLTLRQMIGVLGTSLPFIVSIGALVFFGQPLQPSISAYYYTGMRDVMVGMLTATGLFLFSYKGYARADAIAGKLACFFALGVAYFPTAPADPTPWQNIVSGLHLFFAAGFFLTLSYFCVFLFVKTNPSGYPPMTVNKMYRNSVYRVCGGVMVVCMALMTIYAFAGGDATGLTRFHPTFWLETYAILAFGVSWLTKGEAILKDEE
jgi:hypothetical protein